MKTNLLIGSGILTTAVILGAFGAHSLKDQLSEYQIGIFETGVRYQFYHGLGLLILGILMREHNSGYLKWAGYLLSIGVLLFSGSLYLLAVRDLVNLGSFVNILGPITPIGGLCFITGWILVFINFLKN